MTRTARPRHSVDGGYQRGEETRARIISAAMRLFGERGFDGASTRDIAASAGVNAPALQYYFDNKEGVYAACAEHIVERVWAQMLEVIEAAEATLADERTTDQDLIDAYCAIQARTISFVCHSREADEWRLFMAREQAGLGPSIGFKIIYERVNKRMYGATSGIVARLLGQPPTDEETMIRAMTLGGPIHVFHVMRRSAFKTLGWEDIEGERLATLKRIIQAQTVQLLNAMVAERKARTGELTSEPTSEPAKEPTNEPTKEPTDERPAAGGVSPTTMSPR